MKPLASIVGGVLLLAPVAAADEVQLKNGDRLSGTLVSMSKDTIVFKTDYAGDLKIARADVTALRTDAPVTVQLPDGTRFSRRIEPGEPGSVTFAGAPDAPSIGAVPLDGILAINPPEIAGTGDITLSASVNRGNTRNQSFRADIDAVRRTEIDRITLDAGWAYASNRPEGSNDDELTERNVFAAAKYDYFFSERWFGYAQNRAEGDSFQDLELRYTAGVGVGYQWYEEPDLKLYTEGGPSYFYEDFDDEDPKDYLAARLAYRIDVRLIDELKLVHNLEWYPSLENADDQFVRFDATLRYPFGSQLTGTAGIDYEWDNTPADGKRRTDVKYIFGIGYSF